MVCEWVECEWVECEGWCVSGWSVRGGVCEWVEVLVRKVSHNDLHAPDLVNVKLG